MGGRVRSTKIRQRVTKITEKAYQISFVLLKSRQRSEQVQRGKSSRLQSTEKKCGRRTSCFWRAIEWKSRSQLGPIAMAQTSSNVRRSMNRESRRSVTGTRC